MAAPPPAPAAGAATPIQANEVTMREPPTDGISSLSFEGSSDLLLASSWDTTVRLYDARRNEPKGVWKSKAAVLDSCFWDAGRGFAGGLDKSVRIIDFQAGGPERVLGHHDNAVRCLRFHAATGLLFSGGWDARVNCWDPRAPVPLRHTLAVPNKVFAMALSDSRVVIGTSGRQIVIYDVRNLSEPEQRRESSLKYQTRCIRCFPDGSGYAVGSIEGRVAVDFFDLDPTIQAQKYAFKCHRQGDTVYPVNAMAFHPRHGTFATGGCDKVVSIWDGDNKKRLAQLTGYPAGISALAFSGDGSLLAIGSSYTFEDGEKQHPQDQIYMRQINDADVRKKTLNRK